MSVDISFDDDDGRFTLCSASEWSAFALWAEELGGLAEQLAKYGTCRDTAALAAQLRDAPYQPPIVDDLLSYIGVGDAAETVRVSM